MNHVDAQIDDLTQVCSVLEQDIKSIEDKLQVWCECDRSDPNNHPLYYELVKLIESLNERIDDYDVDASEVEYLLTITDKGSHYVNN